MKTSSCRPDRAWVILVVLTLGSLAVASSRAGEGTMVAAALVLGATWIKSRQVLDHFLGLKDAGGGWRTGFALFLLGLLVALLGISAFV